MSISRLYIHDWNLKEQCIQLYPTSIPSILYNFFFLIYNLIHHLSTYILLYLQPIHKSILSYLSFNLNHFYPLNPYNSIHLYPPFNHIYSFLSSTYPLLSFSIFDLFTLILFYHFCNFNHPYLFDSEYLYPSLSLILWQSRILLIFLNLYLLIHVNSFLSFLRSIITTIFLNPCLSIQFYPPLIHVYTGCPCTQGTYLYFWIPKTKME